VVAAEQLIRREGWLLLDVRSARDFGKECATAFGAKGIASVRSLASYWVECLK
jgi:hypothetical protein